MRTILSIAASDRLDGFVVAACGTAWSLRLIVHPRARRLRLACDPIKGEFRLTVPPRVARRKAIAWAEGHRSWAREQAATGGGPRVLGIGSTLPLMGRDVAIAWDETWPRTPRLDGDTVRVGGPRDAAAGRIERWVKAQARTVLTRETHAYAAQGGLVCAGIGIGDPRSRWGSCSARGTIRYNWRLILAPDCVRRATVAHEVAHLGHLDHSARFHALHAELFEGDVVAARAWLRDHGQGLRTIRFG